MWWLAEPKWESGEWAVRSEEMFLIPGDSPMGLRLPLHSLLWYSGAKTEMLGYAVDPTAARGRAAGIRCDPRAAVCAERGLGTQAAAGAGRRRLERHAVEAVSEGHGGQGNRHTGCRTNGLRSARSMNRSMDASNVVRTALCIEPRNGVIHVFMPPLDRVEDYLELVTAVEDTATALAMPVVVEGYLPPHDPRLDHIKVTPDPGVIEVNIHPAHHWDELVDITTSVYEDARLSRLGTEKFDLDGTHTGTGGGNHVVLGGKTPGDSPFVRRPDLLRSLVAYWHNHPSLSYLLSGSFIGPTSQSPRVDEGRRDSTYELSIAFEQVPEGQSCPPWLVDRVFRHLLVDGTGNTHRSEFCIDKLWSPDSSSGRLGLVEFRAFEMPPHARMSLAQQVLLRALVARFWAHPYKERLVTWDTTLHDRFMLPHFVRQDFEDVMEESKLAGLRDGHRMVCAAFRVPLPGDGRVCAAEHAGRAAKGDRAVVRARRGTGGRSIRRGTSIRRSSGCR